ncbi:hypothetical protein B0H14DRAFT_2607833 [Mycena olivaceomarginata]|nr:hypothetical protein B0H14DRAFT_2607833 [Mycena olivaceomarginata]
MEEAKAVSDANADTESSCLSRSPRRRRPPWFSPTLGPLRNPPVHKAEKPKPGRKTPPSKKAASKTGRGKAAENDRQDDPVDGRVIANVIGVLILHRHEIRGFHGQPPSLAQAASVGAIGQVVLIGIHGWRFGG